MDIVELKGVNPKMLHGSASQLHVPAAPAHRSHGASAASRDRHSRNTAYCEFDIVASHQLDKNKSNKKPRHDKKPQLERGEPSELSKKIEDLTARNVQIRQMLFAKDTRSTEKLSVEKTATVSDRRHRDRKNRRNNRHPDDNENLEILKKPEIDTTDKRVRKPSCEEKKSEKRGKDNRSKVREEKPREASPKIQITMDSATLQVKEPRRSKHRSRKDLCEKATMDKQVDSSIVSEPIPGSRSSRTSKSSKRSSSQHMSHNRKERFTHLVEEIVEEDTIESKSQLLKIYNYKSDEKPLPDKQVITVFENTRLFEETDSPLSNNTFRKSRTRLPSNTRDHSTGRYEHKPIRLSPRQEDTPMSPVSHKQIKDFQKRMRDNSPKIENTTPRKVLSFSKLNLVPNAQQYDTPPQMATTQTSASRIQSPGYGTVSIAVESGDFVPEISQKAKDAALDLSQTTIALRDIMQVQEFEQKQQSKPRTMRKKFMEAAPLSPHREYLNNKASIKCALSKNSKFHKSKNVDNSDRIVEICSKTCNDQKVTFTVEGVEPPRRLKLSSDGSKSLKVQNVFNLQVFSGITINQESNLNCLNHGSSLIYPNVSNLSRVTNKPLDTLESSTIGLEIPQSVFKPKVKESNEIGYKFRKKSWSSKELPKKKGSKKIEEKKKVKKKSLDITTENFRGGTKEMAVQTSLLHDQEVGDDFISQSFLNRVSTDVQTLALDVDVSTSFCHRDYSKEIQVCTLGDFTTKTVQTPFLPRRAHPIPQFSQSESNISFEEVSVHKRDFCMCTTDTKVPQGQSQKVTRLVGKSSSRVNMASSSVDTTSEVFPKAKTSRRIQPTVVQTRVRKHSHSCVPKPRHNSPPCQSAMSTGSIPTPPSTPSPRKTRSKSLTHRRDSLVDKINYNKATIMHHNQEIAALEKCLNEILNRLVKGDSEPSEGNFKEEHPNGKRSSISKYPPVSPSLSKKQESLEIPTSKFHRAKAYGERIKRRAKRSREVAEARLSSPIGKPKPIKKNSFVIEKKYPEPKPMSPMRVRSVYKNPRGFISSSTSMSSKISELMDHSSSTYPQSIPSLNLGCSTVNRYYLRGSSSSDHRRKTIVKPKHKMYQKEPSYSKKKSQSIFNMLKAYINLVKTPSCRSETESSEDKAIIEDISKIVVLSVSSAKIKRPKNLSSRVMPPVIPEDSSDSIKSPYDRIQQPKEDKCPIVKKPFFITHNKKDTHEVLPPMQNKPQEEIITSADSLEYDTREPPDLCPLTAVFNFEPPSYAYLVYNAEVISPNKPKIEPKAGPSRSDQSPTPSSTTNTKLVSILEEKLPEIAKSPEPSLTFLYRQKQDTKSATSIKFDEPSLPSLPVIPQEKEKSVSDLSPILSRKGYPSFTECMKQLEEITSEIPGIPKVNEPKTKLTSFNCNDRECSQLIFNYTSKTKDKDNIVQRSFVQSPVLGNPDQVPRTRCPRFSFDRHDSSAYHTMTTILDSNSASMYSGSDTGLKNESGYESSKKTNSFKNFFRKKTLLDVFKYKNSHKKKSESGSTSTSTLQDSRITDYQMSQETLPPKGSPFAALEEEEEGPESPYSNINNNKTVMWFNFKKKKRDANMGCDPWCSKYQSDEAHQTEVPAICKTECHKQTKCMSTNTWKGLLKNECPCSQPFEKQQEQCQKYASKVLQEAAERKQGYKKQYEAFEEMPLNVLIGKRTCPCKTMKQSCTETFVNKQAGIQVKQPQRSETVQVKRHVSIAAPRQETESKVDLVSSVEHVEKTKMVEEHSTHNQWVKETEREKTRAHPKTASSKPPPKEVSAAKQLLNDKELFEKLLNNYEQKEEIAERLSGDDKFFRDQIDSAKAGVVPDIQAYEDRPRSEQDRMRGPRFSDKPRPLVQVTKADTTAVHPDDIGTCFARGFRPDNLMLSGDACFHINKQDKVKMSPYMLKNTESIIDFSERETPLDFLLALGFMVDEASNALKDDDIRSRLHAAITEARVWINKITTTQGTLLYLVAYKARPETMRYFLQLVEAIINKRINNAIRLDGFLRVLEDVEAGRLQMINILGEDKFEDEENEEKIVKKQLKNLFISVYNVAEKEAAVTGRKLNVNQIALLRILVAKYRAGLHPHLNLIARYIGQGLLENDIQLEAAMIFLSRLDTADVKLKEFENYCGITCQLQEV